MTPMNGRGAGALKALGLLVALAACGGGGGSEPNSQAPSGLSYDLNPAEYVRGATIAPNALHQAGGDPATSFSISPQTLPAGLSFSTSTGTITGTPAAASSQSTYTVTASNAYGSSTVALRLSVRNPTGYVISGSVFGANPGVSVVRVYRTSGDTLLGESTVRPTSAANLAGVWSVEGATAGTYRVDIAPNAQNQGDFKYSPASRSVTVGSSDVSGQDFCIGAMTDRATVCRVTLSTDAPKIGGAPVTFTADVLNWGTSSITSGIRVVIDGDINDYHTFSPDCGPTAGQLPPGACSISGSFSVPSYWSPYPGEHPVHFDLVTSTAFLDYYELPVKLTP